MIALIAVSAAVYAIDKPYSYEIPPNMNVQPGIRVIVPFGRGNRRSEGIVLGVQDGHPSGLKAIERILDLEPILSDNAIHLAAFIRERYFCTFYDAIKAVLPAGLWFDTTESYQRTERVIHDKDFQKLPIANDVLQLIEAHNGRASKEELRKNFAAEEILNEALSLLRKKKYLISNLDFTQKVRDKTERIVSLTQSVEETIAYARKKQRAAPLQYEVLMLLCSIGSGSSKEICYFTGANMQTLRRLESLGYVELTEQEVFRNTLPTYVEPAEPLVLTAAQQHAYETFEQRLIKDIPGVGLLYGVTGSGKTSVYLKLIQTTLERGRSVIYMVPEIALTPQLIQLLLSHFGDTVAVLHSALRVSERYDTWKRIRQGKANVIIGTRSAVFAPVEKLGLLIVDEEQEHSYKSENAPRYHAREIAMYRGNREKALVLLGSATPSIETMYLAQKGVYTFQTLTERYNGKELPHVQIVDMKQEIKAGHSSCLSRPLLQALHENIESGKQSILFLNRRGTSQCLICVDCGEVPHCPNCSVSLTYHNANRRLMCHHCGYSQPAVQRCPVCGGTMKRLGIGTQQIEQELSEAFPGTPVIRMDADTISAKNTHEDILSRFEQEKIPILIGTQMVTKGLNFENVTLVGVVDADMSLYINHYRAAENTFSMLTQVVGRSGRGAQSGRAIIQTMTPEHTVLTLAARQDYDQFYQLEISMRQMQHCPPFGDLFTITFVGLLESDTMFASYRFRDNLQTYLQTPRGKTVTMQILGPSPAPVLKVNNSYRYRLMIKCVNTRDIRLLLSYFLKEYAKDKRNRGVTAFADINSYE